MYGVWTIYVFVGENDPEKGDNLVFSLHTIPVSTISESVIYTKELYQAEFISCVCKAWR